MQSMVTTRFERLDGTRMRRGDLVPGHWQAPPWPLCCAAYSPNGCHILSSFTYTSLRLWDAKKGDAIFQPFHRDSPRDIIAYTPKSQFIAYGSSDSSNTHIYGTGTGEIVGEALRDHSDAVLSAIYSPDGC
jgi:WD40 repeat protein